MNRISDWLCSDGNNPCEARRFTAHLQETTRPSLGKSVYSTLLWDSLRFSIGRGQTTNTIALAGTGYHNRRRCRVTTSMADVGRARLPRTIGNKSCGRRGGIRASH